MTESHVQHLFVIARKLFEALPNEDAELFEPLKFYCDWTLHAQMDRGPATARLIRVNEIVGEQIRNGLDVKRFVEDLLAILSLEEVRVALNHLLERLSPCNYLQVDAAGWKKIGWHLAEIVSECPIKISPERMLHHDIQNLFSAIPVSFVSEGSIVRGSGPDLHQPGFSIQLTQARGETRVTFLD